MTKTHVDHLDVGLAGSNFWTHDAEDLLRKSKMHPSRQALLPSLDPQRGEGRGREGGISIGKGRAASFLYGEGRKGAKESLSVCAEATTIL